MQNTFTLLDSLLLSSSMGAPRPVLSSLPLEIPLFPFSPSLSLSLSRAPFRSRDDYLCFGFSGWSGSGALPWNGLRLPVSRRTRELASSKVGWVHRCHVKSQARFPRGNEKNYIRRIPSEISITLEAWYLRIISRKKKRIQTEKKIDEGYAIPWEKNILVELSSRRETTNSIPLTIPFASWPVGGKKPRR